jgi:hypothetical protein
MYFLHRDTPFASATAFSQRHALPILGGSKIPSSGNIGILILMGAEWPARVLSQMGIGDSFGSLMN